MNCLRCGQQMYSVVGQNGAKATCSGCSQYVDCAQCSNPTCADTKCLKCYNRTVTKAPKRPLSGGVPQQDEDF